MNTSKEQVRILGNPPGIPRTRYDIVSLEKHGFRRFYPRTQNQEILLDRIGVVWKGDLKTARLAADRHGKTCYEFSIKSGWQPTPNNSEQDELVSLIQDFSQNRIDLGER